MLLSLSVPSIGDPEISQNMLPFSLQEIKSCGYSVIADEGRRVTRDKSCWRCNQCNTEYYSSSIRSWWPVDSKSILYTRFSLFCSYFHPPATHICLYLMDYVVLKKDNFTCLGCLSLVIVFLVIIIDSTPLNFQI